MKGGGWPCALELWLKDRTAACEFAPGLGGRGKVKGRSYGQAEVKKELL